MSIKIEVKQKTRTTTGDKPMVKQTAYVHDPEEDYPVKFELLIEKDTAPYAPGMYTIDLYSSYYVDKWKAFTLSNSLKLIPWEEEAEKPTSAASTILPKPAKVAA